MPARRISIHVGAARDAWEARRWYEERNPQAAERFAVSLWQALANALSAPERPAPDEDGIRRVRLRGFPHVVLYHWRPPELRVLAIAHGSREPGYWRERT